jgi:glycerate 2-kinase
MKVVIAPDSFKGNMGAAEVCTALANGLREAAPDCEILAIPLADGGEGTARAITLAAGGELRRALVSGPLGDPVSAEFGLIDEGKTAVMDIASASGLELVEKGRLDPMRASSFGSGELILAALDCRVEKIVLGIGGSATVDGGAGLAQALGFDLVDGSGRQVGRGGGALDSVREVRSEGADPRLGKTRFIIACDVTNPLLGPSGAAAVFGPQKGATAETVPILERGLERLAGAWKRAGLADDVTQPGDGAAGGMGAALRILLHAEMRSGALVVMEHSGFFRALENADLVITGEGKTDSQTAGGKLCSVVAGECRKRGVPVALISGCLEGDVLGFLSTYDYAVSTSCGQTNLEAMMRDAPRDLRLAASNLARAWLLGRKAGS